jgi:superfamily II DNA or RNA helicase
MLKESRGSGLNTYQDPKRIDEDAAIEASQTEGGAYYRQVVELIQNATDATLSEEVGKRRVEVVLTQDALYVANTGTPLKTPGLMALLSSHLHTKSSPGAIGRFGLGFKSLAAISDNVKMLSTSIAFEFDRGKTTGALRDALRDSGKAVPGKVPLMRLGFALADNEQDAAWQEIKQNAGLQRDAWATVVRVKLKDASADAPFLEKELQKRMLEDFAELYAITLSLRWPGLAAPRSYDGTPEAPETPKNWKVFRSDLFRVDDAGKDAGGLRRDQYEVQWAVSIVPRGPRDDRAELWAGFPLTATAPVRGLLNAPWKMGNDRVAPVASTDSAFNKELERKMAELIVAHLPDVPLGADPGRPLDFVPMTGDSILAKDVRENVNKQKRRIVANGLGKLMAGKDLKRHPSDVGQKAIEAWLAHVDDENKAKFVHSACAREGRTAALKHLVPKENEESLRTWIEMVVGASETEEKKPERAIAVLRIVAAVLDHGHNKYTWSDVNKTLREAHIVLSAGGKWITAAGACIAAVGDLPPGFEAAHERYLDGEEDDLERKRRIATLKDLGLADASDAAWTGRLGAAAAEGRWADYWDLLNKTPEWITRDFKCPRDVRLKTNSDEWIDGRLLRQGTTHSSEDSRWVIDSEFYRAYKKAPDLLRAGLFNWDFWPGADRLPAVDRVWTAWRAYHYETRRAHPNLPPRTCDFPRDMEVPSAVDLLYQTKDETTRADETKALLESLAAKLDTPEFRSPNVSGAKVDHPVAWLIKEKGALRVDVDGKPVTLKGASIFAEAARSRLRAWLDKKVFEGLERAAAGLTDPAACKLSSEDDGALGKDPDALRREVKEEQVYARKLVIALGGEVEARKALGPRDVTLKESVTTQALAERAIETYDDRVLAVFWHEINKRLGWPTWEKDNRKKCEDFAEELGFPRHYGSDFPAEGLRKREPTFRGRPPLPPKLHWYQENALEELAGTLNRDKERSALLVLPTGTGKTRVAVQAIVEAMVREEKRNRRVLWIADRDELCEQAVEKFCEVWSLYGKGTFNGTRLWGSTGASASWEPDGAHVIVATIHTLQNRLGLTKDADIVVIDEAHLSAAARYESVFSAIRPDAALIGLTATPERHDGEHVGKHFGSNVITGGATDALLREGGFLASLTAETIDLAWSPEQRNRWNEWLKNNPDEKDAPPTELVEDLFPKVPEAICTWVYRLLEEHRTRKIPCKVLIFTENVAQAHVVAELLSFGVTADGGANLETGKRLRPAAIDGTSNSAWRRRAVEEFKKKAEEAGARKVLVNYGCFTTGFDAPKTNVVIIARATASEPLFRQMLGRGLRGKNNGGVEKCTLVTLDVNSERFKDIIKEYEGEEPKP